MTITKLINECILSHLERTGADPEVVELGYSQMQDLLWEMEAEHTWPHPPTQKLRFPPINLTFHNVPVRPTYHRAYLAVY